VSVLERDRGSYLFSCDRCGSVTREVASIYFGEHGEHVDLCGRCLRNTNRASRKDSCCVLEVVG
jgi:uncharacterized C2H2 Zn-finger protein